MSEHSFRESYNLLKGTVIRFIPWTTAQSFRITIRTIVKESPDGLLPSALEF